MYRDNVRLRRFAAMAWLARLACAVHISARRLEECMQIDRLSRLQIFEVIFIIVDLRERYEPVRDRTARLLTDGRSTKPR